MINSQSWAVLSRTATEERAYQCMDSLERHLSADCGYRLVAPPFTKYNPRIGRMSNSMPGYAENGGCYCHAAGFKAIADCMLGSGEKAWETFVKVAPDNPYNPISISETEPFSFTNAYSTNELSYGKSLYPWRTGTAAWFTILLVEWILGARRSYKGLIIDPCLPKELKKAKLARKFRGATFEISIDNSAGKCKGVTAIYLNGEKLEGNILPNLPEGFHKVQVII